MSAPRPDGKQWNNFVQTHLDFEGENNVKRDFSKITKTAGVPYFEFLRCLWVCVRDTMTEVEFCKMNGNIPQKFFEEKVRDHENTKEIEKEISIL